MGDVLEKSGKYDVVRLPEASLCKYAWVSRLMAIASVLSFVGVGLLCPTDGWNPFLSSLLGIIGGSLGTAAVALEILRRKSK